MATEWVRTAYSIAHKPFAESECHVLLFDRAGVVNAGDAPESKLTESDFEWIY